MKKMAVFVEGYTELLFVKTLIEAIATSNTIQIRASKLRSNRVLTLSTSPAESPSRFVSILDCGGDDSVKTRMLREYPTLVTSGYERIVCIRDVFPKWTRQEIPRVERALQFGVPTKPVIVDFVLSVMECEAWFLAEHTHFERIHPELTCELISSALGFDPRHDDMSQRPHPAQCLSNSYSLRGVIYAKGGDRFVSALDFARVYLDTSRKFSHLRLFCDIVDSFLSD